MCLKSAKQCLKLEKMKHFFTRNQKRHVMEVRCTDPVISIRQVYFEVKGKKWGQLKALRTNICPPLLVSCKLGGMMGVAKDNDILRCNCFKFDVLRTGVFIFLFFYCYPCLCPIVCWWPSARKLGRCALCDL